MAYGVRRLRGRYSKGVGYSRGKVVRFGGRKHKGVLGRSVKTIMRASKMKGGWKTKSGVSLYGKAMQKLGFLAGVHKRR